MEKKISKQNPSCLEPIDQVTEQEKREERKGQIYELVSLVSTIVLMKRACGCFKDKDSRSPTKIRLDPFL